jgi:hypothetical protein
MNPNLRFPSRHTVIIFTILILFLIGVIFTLSDNAANASESLYQGEVNLPLVMRGWPPPTPTPVPAIVMVDNDTGGQLCYEIMDTGIGEKCFPVGVYTYGSFPPGTYQWKVSARCGTKGDTMYFNTGVWTHRFWCGSSAGLLERK